MNEVTIERELSETEFIKKRIRDIGLKQKYLADKLKISESNFSHFLSGRRQLPDSCRKDLLLMLGLGH